MIPPEEVSAGTTVASPPGTDDGEEDATEAPEAPTPAAGGGGGEEIPAGTCNVQLSNSIIGTNPSPVDFNGNMNIVDVPNPTIKCAKVNGGTCNTWGITNYVLEGGDGQGTQLLMSASNTNQISISLTCTADGYAWEGVLPGETQVTRVTGINALQCDITC
ncbi:hypothetical protein GCK72_021345 [Caenorhabditis remanei]|uniref:C6 domain-containing protein n=1 Tax=Caenorhabditis remanei TaxID=31234 RepID=A0A6A5GJL4_CAERE|nr:hypothetical protein GCK72_021345 [Caenorhabditis remanei]KAF1754781.1 hypothetical protein GCK72_021345 [Caenorhabditis remanei]